MRKVLEPTVIRSIEGYDWSQILAGSRSEGHRMVSRMLADFEVGTNCFNSAGEVLLAHIAHSTIVAVCGLNREEETAFGRAGRVRRLYVMPARRREGLARSLVEAIAACARDYHDVLTVNAGSPAARVFFEHLGFLPVSHPNITHVRRLEPPTSPTPPSS